MEHKRLNEFICNFVANASLMAYIEEAHGTHMLLQNFDEVFRYIIRGVRIVTIFKEIEVLNKYIAVQKMRYGDRFEIMLDNDEKYKGVFIEHLSIIDFFDSTLIHALDKYENFISICVNLEESNELILIITIQAEMNSDKYVKVLRSNL